MAKNGLLQVLIKRFYLVVHIVSVYYNFCKLVTSNRISIEKLEIVYVLKGCLALSKSSHLLMSSVERHSWCNYLLKPLHKKQNVITVSIIGLSIQLIHKTSNVSRCKLGQRPTLETFQNIGTFGTKHILECRHQ